MENENLIWERQPSESSKAYFAFCAYRDLGPTRSFTKAARSMDKQDSYKNTMAEWSVKYSWLARCKSYDYHEDRKRRKEMEKARSDMNDRHASSAAKMLTITKQGVENTNPDELTPSDIAKWFDIAVKIERLSRGESTENVHQDHTGQFSISEQSDKISEVILSDPEAREHAMALLRICSTSGPYKK